MGYSIDSDRHQHCAAHVVLKHTQQRHGAGKGAGMSDAFEQWAADKTFMLRVNDRDGYVGYVNVREMALEAWQAALQSREPVVDAVVFDILKAAQGSCRLGFNDIAEKQIEIAIKALLSAGKGE